MIPGKLHDWLQIVGLFGVLAGLLFVGLQLRQDRQVAIANAVDETASYLADWAQLVTANSEVWRKGLAGESLSANEILEFEAMAYAWEIKQFANWVRAGQGVSTTSVDRFARQTALELHASPGLRAFWQERESYFSQILQGPSVFIDRVNEELRLLDQE